MVFRPDPLDLTSRIVLLIDTNLFRVDQRDQGLARRAQGQSSFEGADPSEGTSLYFFAGHVPSQPQAGTGTHQLPPAQSCQSLVRIGQLAEIVRGLLVIHRGVLAAAAYCLIST